MGFKDYIKKKKLERAERLQVEKEVLEKVNEILDRFEIPDFDDYFENVLASRPKIRYIHDRHSEKDEPIIPSRKDYLEFMYGKIRNKETSYNQVKDFAIRRKIVAPSFFEIDSDVSGNQSTFDDIINTIRRDFQPEKIKDEIELQSQLAVFLKTKFPNMSIEREVLTKVNDEIDILVDGKYAFELKVPKNRTELRNLSAQLEEYIEEYPKLCVLIADTSGRILPDDRTLDVTKDIDEYADKYKVKFDIQTLIFKIGTRK